jgi:hypothetical protein
MFRRRMGNVQVEDVRVQIEDGRCSDENGRCLGEYDGCSGGGCKMYNWKKYIFWWKMQDVVQVKDERFSHIGRTECVLIIFGKRE